MEDRRAMCSFRIDLSPGRGHGRAFSLLELLVVIALVALLVGILLPALGKARDAGRDAVCRSNLHQFGIAATGFALDHREHLPGVYTWELGGLEDWQRDWLSGTFTSQDQVRVWEHAPQAGTLYSYMGGTNSSEAGPAAERSAAVYRCPSARPSKLGDGVGSNGKYDYTMIGGFGGARLDKFPLRLHVNVVRTRGNSSVIVRPKNPGALLQARPFFVEEDCSSNLNRIGSLAGSFAAEDQIATRHRGTSSAINVDGSVLAWDARTARGLLASSLWAFPIGGSGRESLYRVGIDPEGFGWWNRR